jgi:hypothetical protein
MFLEKSKKPKSQFSGCPKTGFLILKNLQITFFRFFVIVGFEALISVVRVDPQPISGFFANPRINFSMLTPVSKVRLLFDVNVFITYDLTWKSVRRWPFCKLTIPLHETETGTNTKGKTVILCWSWILSNH